MHDELLEAEAVEEESDGNADAPAVPARREPGAINPLRNEARTVAIAAAGGLVAGAATVVAAKVVTRGTGKRTRVRLGRRERPREIVASRSFLVDVHLLGR